MESTLLRLTQINNGDNDTGFNNTGDGVEADEDDTDADYGEQPKNDIGEWS